MEIYVQKDGQQMGPFPETKIRQGIDAGEFAPADLAWTTGRASWQPLSSLINLDMTQPPPIVEPVLVPRLIEAEASAEVQQPSPIQLGEEPLPNPSRNRSNQERMDESSPVTGLESEPDVSRASTAQTPDARKHGERVLYEDADDFTQSIFVEKGLGRWMHSPRVMVTNRRFKADDNSISFQGVKSFSLETTLRNGGVSKAVQAGLSGIGALIMICPAYALTFHNSGAKTAGNWMMLILFILLLWAIPIVLFVVMDRTWTQHTRRRFWEAVILLSGSQGSRRILIAVFEQFPVSVDRWLLLHINGIPKENVDAVLESRRQRFNDSVSRIEEISKAIESSLFG